MRCRAATSKAKRKTSEPPAALVVPATAGPDAREWTTDESHEGWEERKARSAGAPILALSLADSDLSQAILRA
jgi:hypothetical protein